MLLMDPAFEDVGDDASIVLPGVLRPTDEPVRCPFGMFAVAPGHMLGLRGVAALLQRAQMAGHSLVGVEVLHRLRHLAHYQLMRHQLIRHRVVMAVDFDVVVDVPPYLFPFGVNIQVFRQRLERGLPAAPKTVRPPHW